MEEKTVAARAEDEPIDNLAFAALIVGGIAIGCSPIFVRFAEVGPFAAAVWRVGLALPFLYGWMMAERRTVQGRERRGSRISLGIFLPGILFAGDLAFWHLSIMNTTVANATFFANLSALVAAVGAWLFLKERMTVRVAIGLIVAFVGAFCLLGASLDIAPENLWGDIYGIITAFFFGSYMLVVRQYRGRIGPAELMFWSSIVTVIILLLVMVIVGESPWPESWQGWLALVALAIISHAGGQGLIAYALGHLPAALSGLVILVEPVVAALLGWMLLAEVMSPMQLLGGLMVLLGVFAARKN